jgi:hypothetical protein
VRRSDPMDGGWFASHASHRFVLIIELIIMVSILIGGFILVMVR